MPLPEEYIQQYGSDTIIRWLAPHLTTKRKQRIDAVLDHRLCSIQLAIESPADINNALAAVRTSEVLGLGKMHIIAPEHDAQQAPSITQGAIYWMDVCYHATLHHFLTVMKNSILLLVGSRVTATRPLSAVPIDQPLCILIGNEQRGLSSAARNACHLDYGIPMYGMSQSFNLSVAAGISLYDLTSRRRQYLQQSGDLTDEERRFYQAKYYLGSVTPQLLRGLIARKNRAG